DPSQKYVLKSMEKKSKTPFVLGVLLASFVLYFKSFLSSSESAAIAEDENADRHGDPEGDLREQEMAAATITPPPIPQPKPDEDAGLGSGSRLVEEFPDAYFFQVPNPERAFSFDL